jgi:hypothetical protein
MRSALFLLYVYLLVWECVYQAIAYQLRLPSNDRREVYIQTHRESRLTAEELLEGAVQPKVL